MHWLVGRPDALPATAPTWRGTLLKLGAFNTLQLQA